MKNNILKYILFSLILLFGVNLYSGETYAATSWCPSSNPACQSDKVYTTIKCNYKIDKCNYTSDGKSRNNCTKNFYIYRKLEVDSKTTSSITYSISDYSSSNKIMNNANKGTDYYKTSYSCPKSIAYYDSLRENSDIYYSTSSNGADKWIQNLDGGFLGIGKKGSSLTTYKYVETYVDTKKYPKISLLKNCKFKDDNDETLIFYTLFSDDKPEIKFYAKNNVPPNPSTYYEYNTRVGGYKNHEDTYNAIISGNCDENEHLQYAYFNPTHVDSEAIGMGQSARRVKTGYIIFSNNGDVINNSDPGGLLDYGYKNYILFKSENLVSIVKKNIEETYKKTQECDELMKKNCKNADDDSEKCKEAKQICYEAEIALNKDCSETNKKLVNEDIKKKCDEISKTITNYKNEGFTFEINVVVTCETLGKLRDKLQTYFTIIKVLTPVLIIGLSVVDFVQATTSSDDDAFKKAKDKFVKRLIIGVIIFLLPYLVDIVLQLIDDYYQTSTCGIK